MDILEEVLEDDKDVDEAYLLAKSMAEQEEIDNRRRRVKSTFWATIVSTFVQGLTDVRVRKDDE